MTFWDHVTNNKSTPTIDHNRLLGLDPLDIIWLARSLNDLTRNPGLLESFRVRDAGLRVITTRPSGQTIHPFAQDIEWLVLEERFAFYSGVISFIEPAGRRPTESPNASADVFYGPFAVVFRSVVLAEHGHVNLTEGQAAVFAAL